MGMYTELVLKCEVKEKLPVEVGNILNYLFNDGELDKRIIPNHKFFTLPRWTSIGSSSSFYHHPKPLSNYNNNVYLFSRSDLKNYDGEIEEFLDWLRPYIEKYDAEAPVCIGWTWYEEDEMPTLIFA